MPVDRMLHPRIHNSRKIGLLSHLEFRVWAEGYLLKSDDFGVLPMEATEIKTTRGLRSAPERAILAALERMVDVGLLRRFDHQEQPFVWSHNWQFNQHIRYPRREETHFPAPPEPELRALVDDEKTRTTLELFATFHTQVSDALRADFGDPVELSKILSRKARKRGGNGGSDSGNVPGMDPQRHGNGSGTLPEYSGSVSETSRECSEPRVPARAQGARNGSRLTADGSGPEALWEGLETLSAGLISRYVHGFTAVTGSRPSVDITQAQRAFDGLLRVHDAASITAAMEAMFAHCDEFVQRAGYPIPLFVKQFNAFAVLASRSQRSRWCEHEPPCHTTQEHTLRTLNDARAERGESPLEVHH